MKIYNYNTEKESGLMKYREMISVDSPVFQAVEKELDAYLDGNPYIAQMYEGEEAIYTKRGAVISAIDQIIEVMDEYDLPFIYLNDKRIDLTAAWQD